MTTDNYTNRWKLTPSVVSWIYEWLYSTQPLLLTRSVSLYDVFSGKTRHKSVIQKLQLDTNRQAALFFFSLPLPVTIMMSPRNGSRHALQSYQPLTIWKPDAPTIPRRTPPSEQEFGIRGDEDENVCLPGQELEEIVKISYSVIDPSYSRPQRNTAPSSSTGTIAIVTSCARRFRFSSHPLLASLVSRRAWASAFSASVGELFIEHIT